MPRLQSAHEVGRLALPLLTLLAFKVQDHQFLAPTASDGSGTLAALLHGPIALPLQQRRWHPLRTPEEPGQNHPVRGVR